MNDHLEDSRGEDYDDPHDHIYLWLDEPDYGYYVRVRDVRSFEWKEE
jgi:hypothetical protein